jgi:hypothetical protein
MEAAIIFERAGLLHPLCTLGAAFGLLVSTSQPGSAQLRTEVRPVETVTLSTQQFLTGNQDGKPTMLAGELRIPKPGTDKLAAVILIHGSGGIGADKARWIEELNSAGVATFLVDSFSGRGIFNTINDQSQLDSLPVSPAKPPKHSVDCAECLQRVICRHSPRPKGNPPKRTSESRKVMSALGRDLTGDTAAIFRDDFTECVALNGDLLPGYDLVL